MRLEITTTPYKLQQRLESLATQEELENKPKSMDEGNQKEGVKKKVDGYKAKFPGCFVAAFGYGIPNGFDLTTKIELRGRRNTKSETKD